MERTEAYVTSYGSFRCAVKVRVGTVGIVLLALALVSLYFGFAEVGNRPWDISKNVFYYFGAVLIPISFTRMRI